MINRLYKTIWSRIGGRPWSHIIRESPRLSAVVGAVFLSIGLASLRAPRPVILAAGLGIGFILGHLFW